MSVQVFYKNKGKSNDLGVVAIFGDEKFQTKNLSATFSKNETTYIQKILKNKRNTKESIISFNLNDKSTVILISIQKNLKRPDVESLGAKFYNFIKINNMKNISIYLESINS